MVSSVPNLTRARRYGAAKMVVEGLEAIEIDQASPDIVRNRLLAERKLRRL